MLIVVSFSGCKKEEKEDTSFFTDEQEEIIIGIQGTWTAKPWNNRKIQFENYVDFDKFPNWIYKGEDVIFQVQGDCILIENKDTTPCFFHVSKGCDQLELLSKSDSTYALRYRYFCFLSTGEFWAKYYLSDKNYQKFEK